MSSNGPRADGSGALDAQAVSRRAQYAASAHTWTLCDEIDRTQQHLNELRTELEGAIALCTSVFDHRCDQQDLDTLARAERILDELAK